MRLAWHVTISLSSTIHLHRYHFFMLWVYWLWCLHWSICAKGTKILYFHFATAATRQTNSMYPFWRRNFCTLCGLRHIFFVEALAGKELLFHVLSEIIAWLAGYILMEQKLWNNSTQCENGLNLVLKPLWITAKNLRLISPKVHVLLEKTFWMSVAG